MFLEFREKIREDNLSHQERTAQTIDALRYETNKSIETLSQKMQKLQTNQTHSPWHDSRWAFDETGEHRPSLTSLPTTLPITTITTASSGACAKTTGGPLLSRTPFPLSTATPAPRSYFPPRTLQFKQTLKFHDHLTSPLNDFYDTTHEPPPAPIARPQPIPRTSVPNMHKIISSWELQFPGHLDANDFLAEFKRQMLASDINPNHAVNSLSQVLKEHVFTWYNTFRNTWTTWNKFANKFRHTFGEPIDDEYLTNKIQNLV